MSRPYAEVIGDPIAQSKSPTIHNFWLAKLGIDAEYRRCHVRAEELADYFAQRRGDADWRGCNITIPHKVAAASLVDTVTRDAKKVGAINAVRRAETGQLHGRNTDVHGVARALDRANVEGNRVVMVGAGGAARAAARILHARRPATVTIMNRSGAKAQSLLEEFRLQGHVSPLGPAPEADVLINATSLGMTGQPELPVSLENLAPGATVFDMVYAPLETQLLKEARNRGLRTVDGLTMLIAQASEAFATFYSRSAPRKFDAELRALLTA